jgi:hypothetical protein
MKFAFFNSVDGRVLQWQDHAAFNYAPTDAALLHPCTEEEFAAGGDMAVINGVLVPYVAPVIAPPTPQQIKAGELVKVRALRAALFPTLAGLQSEALARGNSADALAIATVQQQCRDITKTDLSKCTDAASVDAAFKAAWLAIAKAAPASVQLAFAGLNQ